MNKGIWIAIILLTLSVGAFCRGKSVAVPTTSLGDIFNQLMCKEKSFELPTKMKFLVDHTIPEDVAGRICSADTLYFFFVGNVVNPGNLELGLMSSKDRYYCKYTDFPGEVKFDYGDEDDFYHLLDHRGYRVLTNWDLSKYEKLIYHKFGPSDIYVTIVMATRDNRGGYDFKYKTIFFNNVIDKYERDKFVDEEFTIPKEWNWDDELSLSDSERLKQLHDGTYRSYRYECKVFANKLTLYPLSERTELAKCYLSEVKTGFMKMQSIKTLEDYVKNETKYELSKDPDISADSLSIEFVTDNREAYTNVFDVELQGSMSVSAKVHYVKDALRIRKGNENYIDRIVIKPAYCLDYNPEGLYNGILSVELPQTAIGEYNKLTVRLPYLNEKFFNTYFVYGEFIRLSDDGGFEWRGQEFKRFKREDE